jgi:RimJ/RimL family protein N-acetyltransferase
MDLTPVVLEGDAVRLEPLSLDHLDALLEAGSDPQIWRYTSSACTTPESMRAFIEEALGGQRLGSVLPFATIDRKSGRPIGSTRFGNIAPEHKRVEIGWTWISPAWQRTAINTEAKYLMLRYAFDKLGCNRVELKTNARNLQSRTAIRRIGALEEGTLRSHMINSDGSVRDTVYYSILVAEWPPVRSRLESLLGH